eukprot:GHVL01032575.1.p1 GENE.GHVL01032575.1~~GHVL01032575.1.p1  ORF type:complete len:148 (-),score=22.67 GHVL01032575.1:252-695(-)
MLIGKVVPPKALNNWERLLDREIEWTKVFLVAKKIKEVKLKWFQIKINNRILVTNSMLKDKGVIASNQCSFCNVERDTILHYLWLCEHTQSFGTEFEKHMKEKCQNCSRLALSPTLVLFGYDQKRKTDEGFDYNLLQAKFYIYINVE